MPYCNQCVLPDSRPNLVIGEDGVCNACRSHGQKTVTDWASRRQAFEEVVSNAKKRSSGYDCLIPVSGGKDSHWQVIKCLEYGLNPLALTWKTPVRTGVGQDNLDNLVSLGVDHIDYQVNPKVEARFMLEGFCRYGSTAIPMHMAIFNMSLSMAVKFKTPLVVWGENPAFEYGSEDEAYTGFLLDSKWVKTFGVTHGTTARDWVSYTLTEKELTPYFGPTDKELERAGVNAIFLGYYFEWDPDMTSSVAAAHGFKADTNGPRTGYYDYADIDDDFISLHHWMKWYKFGFTRLFDNLSLEIRNGRITREQALDVIREYGIQTPHEDIEKFCEFVGIEVQEFWNIAGTFRNRDVWTKRADTWVIKDFLIEDWNWS